MTCPRHPHLPPGPVLLLPPAPGRPDAQELGQLTGAVPLAPWSGQLCSRTSSTTPSPQAKPKLLISPSEPPTTSPNPPLQPHPYNPSPVPLLSAPLPTHSSLGSHSFQNPALGTQVLSLSHPEAHDQHNRMKRQVCAGVPPQQAGNAVSAQSTQIDQHLPHVGIQGVHNCFSTKEPRRH